MLVTDRLLSRLGPCIPHRGGVVRSHGKRAAMKSAIVFSRFLFNIKRKKTNKQHQELYLCSSVYFLSSWFFISFLQCSFQPDECKDNTEVRPNLAIGSTLQCFFNPEDTHQIVRIKASTESYNELLVSQVVWPLAIMMLGIVIIAAASCYYFSRNVNRYEELPGKSSATLLLTIWKIHQRMFIFCSRVMWHFILGLYEWFKYLVWKFSRILKAKISRRTIF